MERNLLTEIYNLGNYTSTTWQMLDCCRDASLEKNFLQRLVLVYSIFFYHRSKRKCMPTFPGVQYIDECLTTPELPMQPAHRWMWFTIVISALTLTFPQYMVLGTVEVSKSFDLVTYTIGTERRELLPLWYLGHCCPHSVPTLCKFDLWPCCVFCSRPGQ